jgi:hypothetical protein
MFPTDPTGLPDAARPELVEVANGETLQLRITPIAKRLARWGGVVAAGR